MSRFHSSLGHCMGYQEEVKASIGCHFTLLNEATVNIGAFRWIDYRSGPPSRLLLHLKESLAHSLIDYDQCHCRQRCCCCVSILRVHHDFQLLHFIINYLLSHRVSNSIPVDEHMFRQLSPSMESFVRMQCA